MNHVVEQTLAARGRPPGGLHIDTAAVVCLDAFTQSNVTSNSASTKKYANIFGSYTTCS